MSNSEIYDKINLVFKQKTERITILEEVIDVDVQVSYFKRSKFLKKNLNKQKVLVERELLFSAETSIQQKQDLLAQLASINEVEAFRSVEAYCKSPDEDLKDWSVLAYQESKMALESSFLDETPVFISTGLGGKDNKLRYFIALIGKIEQPYKDYQQSLIRSELKFAFKQHEVDIENLSFINHVAMATVLIPLDVAVRDLVIEPIQSCNEIGDFLDPFFIVTNVRRMCYEDVLMAVEKQKDSIENTDN
jgi:hypothetical protein